MNDLIESMFLCLSCVGESESGLRAKEIVNRSDVIPEDLLISIVSRQLRIGDCWSRGWILDGFPHTESQIKALELQNVFPDKVLFLERTEISSENEQETEMQIVKGNKPLFQGRVFGYTSNTLHVIPEMELFLHKDVL